MFSGNWKCNGFCLYFRQSLLGNRGTDTFASSDPWGMNEDPDNFRGVANNEIQAQQQDIIRGEQLCGK